MKRVLLLGAGFSRNWGGPLAGEMNGRLWGRPQLQDPVLRRAFIDCHYRGGFEEALGHLQATSVQTGRAEDLERLRQAQAAVSDVLADFDRTLPGLADQLFQNGRGSLLRQFLYSFDAIFTLNFDLLLERFYLTDEFGRQSNGRWEGWHFPGMQMVARKAHDPNDNGLNNCVPLPPASYHVESKRQPIYKLHGSMNWYDGEREIRIMGYNKARAIADQSVLQRYLEAFQAILSDDSKLMIIGYGFGDRHINDVLKSRMAQRRPRLFIIDPLGVDVTDELRNAAIRPQNPYLDLIDGYSLRGIRETFSGHDPSEHSNILRFLQD